MQVGNPFHEVLYISSLRSGEAVSNVGRIISSARSFNKSNDISGLLIFDGLRFCQQFEGPPEQVLALLGRIQQDSRHSGFQILHEAPVATRRFNRFTMGYTVTDDVDVLAALEELRGQPAMQAFLDLHSILDMGS